MNVKVGDFVLALRNPFRNNGQYIAICKIVELPNSLALVSYLPEDEDSLNARIRQGVFRYIYENYAHEYLELLTLENASDILKKQIIRKEYKQELQEYLKNLLLKDL